MALRSLLVCCSLIVIFSLCQANDHSAFANTLYTAFSKGYRIPMLSTIQLTVFTRETSNVSVTITANYSVLATFVVSRDMPHTYEVDNKWIIQSSTETNKGLRIAAEPGKKIAAYAANFAYTTAASFPVLPSVSYPVSEYTYYALSSAGSEDGMSTIVLVASSNDTSVTFTPTQNVTLPPEVTGGEENTVVVAHQQFTFMLREAQSVLIASPHDLTATKFVSTKPMAVISGHECATVPSNGSLCDQLLAQVPPTITWGRTFMSLPLQERRVGSVYKVIAAEDNTSVQLKCEAGNSTTAAPMTQTMAISSGGVTQFITRVDAAERCTITADKPIMVGHYSQVRDVSLETFGAPFLMLVSPVEQYMNSTTVTIPPGLARGDFARTRSISIITSYTCLSNDTEVIVNGVRQATTWLPLTTATGTVLGYGTSLNFTGAELIELSLSRVVPMAVFSYGYGDIVEDGYGLSTLTELKPTPGLLSSSVSFSRSNYTFSEAGGSIVLERSDSQYPVSVLVRRCSNNASYGNWVSELEREAIILEAGEERKAVALSIINDNEIEATECVCLEVVSCYKDPMDTSPPVTSTVCIEDDDSIDVELVDAIVDSRQLEIIVNLNYQGEELVTLLLQPQVVDNRRGKRSTESQTIPSIPLSVNKYLSRAVLTIPLSDRSLDQNSAITLTIADQAQPLNIAVSNTSVNIKNTSQSTTPIATPTHTTLTPSQPVQIMIPIFASYILMGAVIVLVAIVIILLVFLFICYCRRNRHQSKDVSPSYPTEKEIITPTNCSLSSYKSNQTPHYVQSHETLNSISSDQYRSSMCLMNNGKTSQV